jgi:RND family efflux transporter MFP subunit
VKKGEVLALIDTPELDDQLKAAEAKVAAEKSEVTVAEANEAFAESTYKRWKESGKGVVSEQEREQKKAEYLSAVAHLKAANSQVDLDQADVNRLTDLTNFKKVEAPYDGVITSRRVDIGDLVTAGSTSGNTPLYDIAYSDKIRVYVDVPQAASADVMDGTVATAAVQEYPGRVFTGKVTRNSQAINEAAKTLRVEVDFDNGDLALKPGMYLEATFKTTEAAPPLQIPASALNFRTNGPTVAVVGTDGRVQFRSVTIAQDLGNVVEIESGLQDGDLVALNISNQVADGDKVQPVEPDDASKASPPSKGAAVAERAG